jgi:hypothetical protein
MMASRRRHEKLHLLSFFAQPLLPERQDEVRPGIRRYVCNHLFLESSAVTNRIPGVISGVGKGIIGTAPQSVETRYIHTNAMRAFSLLVWPTPENLGFKGHFDQDRPVSQY